MGVLVGSREVGGRSGHWAAARGRRLALGCTAIASYGAGWLPKAVIKIAQAEIWTGGRFEPPKPMMVDPGIHGFFTMTIGPNRLKSMHGRACGAALTDP